jgi:hypothetical protein
MQAATKKKLEKPKRERTGLVNLPCGGRAFQFPLLHDDKAIAQILRIQEYRQDTTLTHLAVEAIALLFEQEDRLHRQGRCVEGTSTPRRPRKSFTTCNRGRDRNVSTDLQQNNHFYFQA